MHILCGAADVLLRDICDVFILMPILIVLLLIGVLVKFNRLIISLIYRIISSI